MKLLVRELLNEYALNLGFGTWKQYKEVMARQPKAWLLSSAKYEPQRIKELVEFILTKVMK